MKKMTTCARYCGATNLQKKDADTKKAVTENKHKAETALMHGEGRS